MPSGSDFTWHPPFNGGFGDNMFKEIQQLKIINAFYGLSISYGEFTNRPSHVLVFKISGESEYQFADRKIILSENEIIFIPAGESYFVRKLSDGEGQYALVNFSAVLSGARPEKYQIEDAAQLAFVFGKLVKACLFSDTTSYYKGIALFYYILSMMVPGAEKKYCSPQQRQKLEPAICYLQEHIFDSELKTEKLHTFCGISDTYFRKLFISEFGVSPKHYIMNKRLDQAKNIIDNGDFTHVYQVAESVGYTDALYFSRIFKRRYGYAPSSSVQLE